MTNLNRSFWQGRSTSNPCFCTLSHACQCWQSQSDGPGLGPKLEFCPPAVQRDCQSTKKMDFSTTCKHRFSTNLLIAIFFFAADSELEQTLETEYLRSTCRRWVQPHPSRLCGQNFMFVVGTKTGTTTTISAKVPGYPGTRVPSGLVGKRTRSAKST